MNTLVLLAHFSLPIILAPLALTQSAEPARVICAFRDSIPISNIPARCKAIWFNYFFFDQPLMETDISTLSSLATTNLPIYVAVAFMQASDWNTITNTMDTTPDDKNLAALQKFIKDYKISGLILDGLGIFSGKTPNYATVVNRLVCKIKSGSPTVAVGVLINGYETESYGKKNLFDFSVASTTVDFFLVDLQTASAGQCTADTHTRFSMKIPVNKIVTMEEVSEAVTATGIDKQKLFLNFEISVRIADNGKPGFKSYSEYCSRTPSTSTIWCGDSVEILYDLAKYFKPQFNGVTFSYLDLDDIDGTCGCEKYVITNTYLDAWESKPLKCCEKISGSH